MMTISQDHLNMKKILLKVQFPLTIIFISQCYDPIPSEIVQVVGKIGLAINAFANRLFAIVYLK